MLPWITALKVFNEGKPSWCVPRKGTADYEEIQKLRQRKPKTESPKEQHVTIPMAKKEEPWTPFPDTPPSSPKPRAETLTEKLEREALARINEEARKRREAREKYEREHRDGYIEIPKTADEPTPALGQGGYRTAPPFTEEQLVDLNRFGDDYRRFGMKVNEARSKSAPIRNAEYHHKVGTDTVSFFWRVSGKHILDEARNTYVEHDDHSYYRKTYTFGKPLPPDPPIKHPGKKEVEGLIKKGQEGHEQKGIVPVATKNEKDDMIEIAFRRTGETKTFTSRLTFKRESATTFKALSPSLIPPEFKGGVVVFD